MLLGVGDYVYNDLGANLLELARVVLEPVSVAGDHANAFWQICEAQVSPEHRYLVPGSEQCTRNMSPDEAGSTKNEYAHEKHHIACLFWRHAASKPNAPDLG